MAVSPICLYMYLCMWQIERQHVRLFKGSYKYVMIVFQCVHVCVYELMWWPVGIASCLHVKADAGKLSVADEFVPCVGRSSSYFENMHLCVLLPIYLKMIFFYLPCILHCCRRHRGHKVGCKGFPYQQHHREPPTVKFTERKGNQTEKCKQNMNLSFIYLLQPLYSLSLVLFHLSLPFTAY